MFAEKLLLLLYLLEINVITHVVVDTLRRLLCCGVYLYLALLLCLLMAIILARASLSRCTDVSYFCFPEEGVSVTKARLATEELYKMKKKTRIKA